VPQVPLLGPGKPRIYAVRAWRSGPRGLHHHEAVILSEVWRVLCDKRSRRTCSCFSFAPYQPNRAESLVSDRLFMSHLPCPILSPVFQEKAGERVGNQEPQETKSCGQGPGDPAQRIAPPRSCHPERSLARSLRQTESKDLQLLLLCSVLTQSLRIDSVIVRQP
jgi:hypothetical protein